MDENTRPRSRRVGTTASLCEKYTGRECVGWYTRGAMRVNTHAAYGGTKLREAGDHDSQSGIQL